MSKGNRPKRCKAKGKEPEAPKGARAAGRAAGASRGVTRAAPVGSRGGHPPKEEEEIYVIGVEFADSKFFIKKNHCRFPGYGAWRGGGSHV